MSQSLSQIYIVDDDVDFIKSLEMLLRSVGFAVDTFLSAEEFLEKKRYASPCCLLLDVTMPKVNGPELQIKLKENNIYMPIIFLTGLGDVPTGISVMKKGAEDFLLKPVEEDRLLEAINKALKKSSEFKQQLVENKAVKRIIKSLSPREHEVFLCIIKGMLNKQIAYELGITERTVKFHRSNIVRKVKVDSVAELFSLAHKAGIFPSKNTPKHKLSYLS